jgi:glutaredoxin 3
MANIVIYTKDYCPYCHRAKALLTELGQSFEEIDLVQHPDRRDEMIEKAKGASTVPQIFIDGAHIGGCDDLHALHEQGKLTSLF